MRSDARKRVEERKAEPDADEREALAKRLYDEEGFHAADHWGVESPITRGRYEALADAVLRYGYTRTPDAHLAATKAEGAIEALEEAASQWDRSDEDHLADLRALAAQHYSPGGPSMPAIWLRARAARLREQGGE